MASAHSEEPAELIVVEDGTSAVSARDLGGARLLRLPHVGRSAARNAGVEAASTQYIAFLDEDDVMLPGRLERQRAAFAAAPTAGLAFGRIEAIGEAGEHLAKATAREARRFDALVRRGADREGLLVDCPIYTSATMVRRRAFLDVHGYDEALDAYEDLDLYLRLATAHGLTACLGAAVALHRRHPGNTPSDSLFEGSLFLAEKHLPRARGRERRLLLERRVDALWGLARFTVARDAARRALVAEPALAGNMRFAKRLLGTLLPIRMLERRRR